MENDKVNVPPIKCQGIKTKLVPWIKYQIEGLKYKKWIEPFFGSGVVGFNLAPKDATFCDLNPHIIALYTEINNGKINSIKIKNFLEQEGKKLSKGGKEYYYEVRARFNEKHKPIDFLFLNRSCFNGIIRFNSKGEFNVPFCHKPERFAKAYVTKIINQVKNLESRMSQNNWKFVCQDFTKTLTDIDEDSFVYCDPPYIGRHVDYYGTWNQIHEQSLHDYLTKSGCKFVLSTWHSNQHRDNIHLYNIWSDNNIVTKEHFYYVGAKKSNRKPMLEALVLNFKTKKYNENKNKYV